MLLLKQSESRGEIPFQRGDDVTTGNLSFRFLPFRLFHFWASCNFRDENSFNVGMM